MEKQIISLTFDDGWLSQLENAMPLLEDYKLPGTFYIVINNMKKGGLLYMNKKQVQDISDLGHEIGSHSVSHPLLPYFFWINKQKEISKSKEALQALIGKEVKSFAYPYGHFNRKIVDLVSDAGYKNARTTGEHFLGNFAGFNSMAVKPFEISCKAVKKDTTVEDVKNWISIAKEHDFWLVLNFHQVIKNPYKWGCTPALFEEVCKLISGSNVQVKSVSDAFKDFSVVKK